MTSVYRPHENFLTFLSQILADLIFLLQSKVEKQGIEALDTTLSFDEIQVINENIEYLTKSLGVNNEYFIVN